MWIKTGIENQLVRTIAMAAFLVYLTWNIFWLAHRTIPPSILTALCGLPCPTTGGCRSILALMHGNFRQSILWNPLSLIYCGLIAYSGITMLRQACKGEKIHLSSTASRAWYAALLVGWAAKFAIGPRYW